MKKYLFVTDSTSALDVQRAEELEIVLVPLSVIIDGKEYLDHYEISHEMLYEKLREGRVPTTSQPSVGYIEALMEKWKEEEYEAIIIVTCSSGLSGTHQSFHIAKENVGLDNVHLIDSLSVAAPIMDAVIEGKKMADAGSSLADILACIERKCANTFSFLLPETLTQLKKGGRISPVAANMASLLKIKPLLYLADNGRVVDKFAMARTEHKLFQMAVDQFIKEGVNALTHKVYVPQADNVECANRFISFLQSKLGDITCEILNLPAVLTCHGGMGCIAMQTTLK